LARDVAIHDDLDDSFAVRFSNDDELEAGLRALTHSADLRARLAAGAVRAAAARSWRDAAAVTVALYSSGERVVEDARA
jgi:hypothetical protein